jgi:uncharacterized protein YndB with AHSA1/START domain
MSSTTTDPVTTTVQVFRVYIKAAPERVWEAITSPEWNGQYGYHSASEFDLRPGGRFRSLATPEMLQMGAPETVVDGEVIECDPPHKLVQTWKMHFTPELIAEPYTTVTYELSAEGDELTRVTVTHDVTGAPVHASQIVPGDSKLHEGGGGWAFVLSDLKSLLESGHALEH